MKFDRASDPHPLTAKVAVKRARYLINVPVKTLLVISALIALSLIWTKLVWALALGILVMLIGFILAWGWWSYATPKWRIWALSKGANPGELQTLGMKAGIVWPEGHIFENTEFKKKDSK